MPGRDQWHQRATVDLAIARPGGFARFLIRPAAFISSIGQRGFVRLQRSRSTVVGDGATALFTQPSFSRRDQQMRSRVCKVHLVVIGRRTPAQRAQIAASADRNRATEYLCIANCVGCRLERSWCTPARSRWAQRWRNRSRLFIWRFDVARCLLCRGASWPHDGLGVITRRDDRSRFVRRRNAAVDPWIRKGCVFGRDQRTNKCDHLGCRRSH